MPLAATQTRQAFDLGQTIALSGSTIEHERIDLMHAHIVGATASEIADSVRSAIESGVLPPGAILPPIWEAMLEYIAVRRSHDTAYAELTGIPEVLPQRESGFPRSGVLGCRQYLVSLAWKCPKSKH